MTLSPMLATLLAAIASSPVDRWQPDIAAASTRFSVPIDWIRRVMLVESGGRLARNGRPIRSSAGAMGLMQLMPGTWRLMRNAHGLGADPDHPRDNILAGTAYLRAMYDRFGYPGMFAAYNAGPARYAHHLRTGHPLPSETRRYVALLTGRPVRQPPMHSENSDDIRVTVDPRTRMESTIFAPKAALRFRGGSPGYALRPGQTGLFVALRASEGLAGHDR